MRQNDGPAHHLVGVLGIDSQTHGDFHGLVKFRVFNFLQQRNRILEQIRTRFDRLPRLGNILSCFFHCFFLSPTDERCSDQPW